jgi:hypothetical protein
LLPVFLGIAIFSVLEWYSSELHGRSDLPFNAGVQIAMLILLVALLLLPRYTRSSDFAVWPRVLPVFGSWAKRQPMENQFVR